MTFVRTYLAEVDQVLHMLDTDQIEACVQQLIAVRERNGRLFILGVGGSAANASHAVNDFRNLCGIEAYTPTDNVAELTALINDERNGWEYCFRNWLQQSHLNANDLLFILSVGGGNSEHQVSLNLIAACDFAKTISTPIIGIVGRDGGHTYRVATACILVPTANPERVTPHSEAFQAIFWHLFVSHPELQQTQPKWTGV